jgi:hypothetical protein
MIGTTRALAAAATTFCLFAGLTTAASAETLYVNQRGGEDTSPCSKALPCETIKHAVAVAEGISGPNTIEVEAEGSYENEAVTLNKAADKGLTINGEAGLEVAAKTGPVFAVAAPATAITISNMKVSRETGAGAAIAETGAELALKDLFIENGSTGGKNGVEGHKGSISIEGGTIEMEDGASGFGVSADETALEIAGATIRDAGLGEAGGVGSERSGLSISGTRIIQEGGLSEANDGLIAEEDGSVTLREDSIVQENKDFGALIVDSPASISGLSIAMRNKVDTRAGLLISETPVVTSTLQHVEISGEWTGPALSAKGGSVTLADSRLTPDIEGTAQAMIYTGPVEGPGLLIQRSILRAGPTAIPGALQASNANVTVDSSEILGGTAGAHFESASGAASTFTLSASTLDAGAPGIVNDAFETFGVEALAKSSASSAASVIIQGSVVLERQVAQTLSGAAAAISCAYSSAPGQTQLATSTVGTIGCAAGTNGDTEVSPLSTLFAEPFTAYGLLAGSAAVDSVPASALALPPGLTPSATDLAGNPRVVDGNGDCVAMQDKGALELQGHGAPCAVILIPGHLVTVLPKPVISGLSISPGKFGAAPRGATFAKAKVKYGATIAWRDSQAATATLTVVRLVPGRRQRGSCKRPSAKNRHGRRCTLQIKLGAFTHSDRAGADSGHFSGRLKGHRLLPGSYLLTISARDASGAGATVSRAFKIT